MDIDDMLRQAGQRWRARHSAPAALPDLEQAAARPVRRAQPALVVSLAAAVAVVLIVAGVTFARTLGGPPPPASPGSARPTAGPTTTAPRSPSPTPSTSPSSPGPVAHQCTTGQLRLTLGGRVNEATGQNTRLLVLRNASRKDCELRGYPTVSLHDSHDVRLPFQYRHGRDMMLRSLPANTVRLPAGGSAYFAINKYRCDLGAKGLAVRIRVMPPGTSAPIELNVSRARGLGWCGRGDPGSQVTISPLVSKKRSLFN